MEEAEDEATRLRRKQVELAEAFEVNSRLLDTVHELEFGVLESHRELVRYRRRVKRYLARLAVVLERAGYTVHSLPQALFAEELRETIITQQSVEEEDLKRRKISRPKKAD